MANSNDLHGLQEKIAYFFNDGASLERALTAPGAIGTKEGTKEERSLYEGNRRLADEGFHAFHLAGGPKMLVLRANGSMKHGDVEDHKHHRGRIQHLGIWNNIRLSLRSRGHVSSSTSRLVLFAIIGAVYMDCRNPATVIDVAERIFIVPEQPHYADLQALLEVRRVQTVRQVQGGYAELMLNQPGQYHQKVRSLRMIQPQYSGRTPLIPTSTPRLEVQMTPAHVDVTDTSVGYLGPPPNPVQRQKRPGPSTSKTFLLDCHLQRERERSMSLGACPDEDVEDLAIRNCNIPPENESLQLNANVVFFGIGISESLISFQDVLKVERRLFAGGRPVRGPNISMAARMKAIEGSSQNVAYEIFHKRLHIFSLCVEARIPSHRTSDGFINITPQDMPAETGRRKGNPINVDVCEVSEWLLSQLYPELRPGTDAYKQKKKYIDTVRKLGQKLEFLVDSFGLGILGVFPLPNDDMTEAPNLSISDKNLLSLPCQVFRGVVKTLERELGDFLRSLSSALSPAVNALKIGNLSPSTRFPIEEIEPLQILQFSRGSKELVKLVASPSLGIVRTDM